MLKRLFFVGGILVLVAGTAWPQISADKEWHFAVSGDSRNCGDVVMPAIAQSVLRHDAEFYWHLGDFRYFGRTGKGPGDVDEDMEVQYGNKLTFEEYERIAWGDFLSNQISPFGLLPVYLGIGNHELYESQDEKLDSTQNEEKSRADYIAQFAYWLNKPEILKQRFFDQKVSSQQAYYHWNSHNVDFIYLDNSGDDGFDDVQLNWLATVLNRDKVSAEIRTVVVGMHRALSNSLACGHSMNGDLEHPSPRGASSGRRAYETLVKWKKESGKHIYILASHSHYFAEDIFRTDYWLNPKAESREVLPGWIVGTAGAKRYLLPENLPPDILAKTYTYGYLLATVRGDGSIDFEFNEVTEDAVPKEIMDRYGKQFVNFCFLANRDTKPHPPAESCNDK